MFRIIFSHSALREGWDNLNVFQILTLKDSAGTYVSGRGDCPQLAGNVSKTITSTMANESHFAKGNRRGNRRDVWQIRKTRVCEAGLYRSRYGRTCANGL
jgi:hypothetical protein